MTNLYIKVLFFLYFKKKFINLKYFNLYPYSNALTTYTNKLITVKNFKLYIITTYTKYFFKINFPMSNQLAHYLYFKNLLIKQLHLITSLVNSLQVNVIILDNNFIRLSKFYTMNTKIVQNTRSLLAHFMENSVFILANSKSNLPAQVINKLNSLIYIDSTTHTNQLLTYYLIFLIKNIK